jgi:N-methylhydantoinase B
MSSTTSPLRNQPAPIDPVTLEILWTRLLSVVDEASATFVRTSFSTLVRDANDFAVVLTDANGRSLAQSTKSIPSFISTMPRTVGHFIEAFGADTMAADDAFITNDPWLGSGHLNDASLAMPIIRNGEVIAFAGVVSHLPDVGGRLRNPANREIYEEGLQIPPTRIMRGGAVDETLVNIIRANVRVPDETMGDIWAQITCCRTLAENLNLLLDESGVDLQRLGDEIVQRTETAMRAAIAEVPDGTYRYEMRNDAPKDFPAGHIRIVCSVSVTGDELSVDYTGSSDQVGFAINTVPTYTYAYTAYAIKTILAPWIPTAQGSFTPITVTAPSGSILNPQRPAPTGSRAMMGHMLPPAVYGALAEVLPQRVQAAPGSPLSSLQLASQGARQRFVMNAFFGAGQGASKNQDGESAISFPSNLSNAAIEVLETMAPIEVIRREIRRGSGGDGTTTGGDGISFEFRLRSDAPATAAFMVTRTQWAAPGLDGGESGALGQLKINAQQTEPVGLHDLAPGDVVLIETAGGGGFGPPGNSDRNA